MSIFTHRENEELLQGQIVILENQITTLKQDKAELLEALNNIISNLPFGINNAYSITTENKKGVTGTMGPNMTNSFKGAIQKARLLLIKHSKGEK